MVKFATKVVSWIFIPCVDIYTQCKAGFFAFRLNFLTSSCNNRDKYQDCTSQAPSITTWHNLQPIFGSLPFFRLWPIFGLLPILILMKPALAAGLHITSTINHNLTQCATHFWFVAHVCHRSSSSAKNNLFFRDLFKVLWTPWKVGKFFAFYQIYSEHFKWNKPCR